MADVLRIVGTIAGIGGISLGIVLLIFRDFIRDFIQSKVFKTLSSAQATILMGSVIVFTFSIAIVGIYAGFVKDTGPTPFILLVVILLLFILFVLYIVTKQMNLNDKPLDEKLEQSIFSKVHNLLANAKVDEAETLLTNAIKSQNNSAEFWYWKSRIAFARGNKRVASAYIDEALLLEKQYAPSLALKIKLLILSGSKNDRAKAKELAEKSIGISAKLDIWLNCLKAENMFSVGPKSNHEIDGKCSFPYDK
jgi:hypothetical protein